QIVSHWFLDPQRHRRLFPMDVRPQSHEIIRTWAFYTIVKALLHENTVPWHHVVISGWILDPERKKMSKSRGNVVTPQHLLDRYSADAVRYWAARASLGVDTAYDESVFKIGGKLVTKIFNAGKFVQGRLEKGGLPDAEIGVQAISEPLDTSFVQHLSGVIARATEAYDQFDYATALRVAELDFWDFCDDYLELVKRRADLEQDSPGKRSGLATLRWALSVYLRLLAPSLPYVTEEVFSRLLADRGFPRSVHISPWPRVDEVQAVPATTPAELYECACEVLTKVRGAKTEAKKNLRWPVVALEVTGSAPNLRLLEAVLPDLCRAGAVAEGAVRLAEGPPPEGERFSVQVTLGSEAAA
ncbi:MAG TPA: class I tRNA ligase family protein, partial [Candidatus Nitrosotenuis sp.]|nr:class I tRNA ligase family protein [Candidatus Nitrosotenuis sp.]